MNGNETEKNTARKLKKILSLILMSGNSRDELPYPLGQKTGSFQVDVDSIVKPLCSDGTVS